ncbi:Acyl-CoA synthetase (AMP-forming)/AMP-acid ligase II [Sinosporangium album]|uniref:Acyl-CoA synthetase (AMP-forming)/AMP-acid ligase II n=1 Tax=Sinosporangium album TaxID=504805 RepID=A0A1G8GP04_9ACTN|nr:condensation domain-containing protein [Sinosporangium album]SDH96036.1 Acyl-CoA synthetase (AMP-forming)/AMP-acid ligase II [Sinosporangium album]
MTPLDDAQAGTGEALADTGEARTGAATAAHEVSVYRASHAQMRMWFSHRAEPGSPYYNSSITLRLTGDLDVEALRHALDAVVARHDALRTVFAELEGELVQVVDPLLRTHLDVHDADAASPRSGELIGGVLRDRIREFTDEPFDLSRGPLLRARLFRTRGEAALLVLTMHHIVVDGWSMGPLTAELSALYRARVTGAEAVLPDLPIQYGDYAEWQRDTLRGPRLDQAVERWRDRLTPPPPVLDLPTDLPRADVPAHDGHGLVFHLDEELTARLRAFSRTRGVTLYTTLMAGFAALLHRYSGQDDIVIGTPASGRGDTAVQPLIGFFVNTLPIRADLSGRPTYGDLLDRVRGSVLAAFADDDIPLDLIVEEVRPARMPGHTPLFDALFTVQSTTLKALDLPGVQAEWADVDHWWTRFDVECNVWDEGERLRGLLVYRTSLFRAATMERVVGQFARLLSAAVTDPGVPVADLPLLDAGDLARSSPGALAQAITRALPVGECAVLTRRGPGGDEPVAAAVPLAPLTEAQVVAAMREALPYGVRPGGAILVSRLPRRPDGTLDQEALAALPVLSADVAGRLEGLLTSVGGVAAASAAVTEVPARDRHVYVGGPLGPSTLSPRPDTVGRPEEADVSDADLSRRREPSARGGGTADGPPSVSDGGPPADAGASDLGAALLAAAVRQDRGVVFVDADGGEHRLAYGELVTAAARVLGGLRALGLKPGDPVLFQLDDVREFTVALWACVLGGIVPVPLAPARTPPQLARLEGARHLLSGPFTLTSDTLSGLAAGEPDRRWHRPAPGDLALLLLTSGSTGTPKAVRLTHRNILTRSAGAIAVGGFTEDDVSLNWMPLDHVGGVVMFHMRDVLRGCEQIQVDTSYVLADPLRWPELASRFRATATWAPNFAFGLVAERAAELAGRGIDLSPLRYVLNGGEAVVPSVARGFLRALAPYGLPETAMRPAWGMSETSSGQTDSERFTLASTSDGDVFTEVGRPYPGFRMRVVDAGAGGGTDGGADGGGVVPEGTVGRLQVCGPAVTEGYYGGAEPEAFTADGWFETGDLAVLRGGRLTITGRAKDVIIVNGVNYYCHDIEAAVEELPDVARSYTAACAVRLPGGTTDRLAVFFHAEPGADPADVLRRVRGAVLARVGVNVDHLVPVEKADIPKTDLGKIQRARLRGRFEDGGFDAAAHRAEALLGGAGTLPDWFHRPAWRPAAALGLEQSGPLEESGLAERGAAEGGPLTSGGPPTGSAAVGLGEAAAGGPDSGGLVLIDDGGALVAALREALVARGVPHTVTAAATLAPARPGGGDTDPPHGVSLRAVPPYGDAPHGLPPDGRPLRVVATSGDLLTVRDLARGLPPFTIVYGVGRQTWHVTEGDSVDPHQAMVPALLRSAEQEIPGLRCRYIDLPAEPGPADLAIAVDELAVAQADLEIAIRGGVRLARRLEPVFCADGPTGTTVQEPAPAGAPPADAPPAPSRSPEGRSSEGLPRTRTGSRAEGPLKRGGWYVVTGGLGGVGVETARYLLTVWDAKVLLLGRSTAASATGATAGAGSAAGSNAGAVPAELAALGDVRYAAADVCDADQVRRALDEAAALWGEAPSGVFHLAGVFVQRPIGEESDEELRVALAAKVEGTRVLHEAVAYVPDAAFVLFSSVNGFFGGALAASYAAACAYQDAFADARRALGLRAQSLAWTMWDETGMSAGFPAKELTRERGFHVLGRDQGIRSLDAALRAGDPHMLIGVDESRPWTRAHLDAPAAPVRRLVAHVVPREGGDPASAVRPQVTDRFGVAVPWTWEVVDRLPESAGGGGDGRDADPAGDTQRLIAEIWCEVLGLPRVGVRAAFFDLGGASLQLARVHGVLQERLGRRVAMVDLFRHPTVESLAEFLDAPEAAPEPAAARARDRGERRLAARGRRDRRSR